MEREKREERKYCREGKEKKFWWRRRSNLVEGGNRFGVKGEAVL